jgi:hypothetical protein
LYRRLKKFFAIDTPSAVRRAILNNTNTYQSFAFANGGFVYQMSFPLITEPEEALQGSAVNALDHPNIMTLTETRSNDSTRVNQLFVGLIRLPPTGGEEHLFPLLTSPKPGQVPGPAPPADAANLQEAEVPSSARLEFDHLDTHFTLFPILLPIPCGVDMPNVHPLGQPFSPELVTHFPALEDWRLATQWCQPKGIHWSCHLPNDFFETAAFAEAQPILTNFEFLPCNTRSIVYSTDYDVMKPRGGPAELAALRHIEELTEAAWDHLAAMAPATPPPETRGIPASPFEGTQWVRTAGAHAVTMLGAAPSVPGFIQWSTKEMEAQQEATTACATYQLLLSRKNPAMNTVSLATLSDSLLAFLNRVGQDTATRAFQCSIRGTLATISAAPLGSSWEVFNNLTPEMFT